MEIPEHTRPARQSQWYLGADLGKERDWTAFSLIEVETYATEWVQASWAWKMARRWHLKYLDRPELGTPYTAIVERMMKIVHQPFLGDKGSNCDLVVDATGVGMPVIDMVKVAMRNTQCRATLVPVWITAGVNTKHDGIKWNVPKKDLVDNLAVMFQNGMLDGTFNIDKRLPLCAALTKEILAFSSKVTKAGNITFEAWRESDHDDLVLSVALAAWRSRARHVGGPRSDRLPAGVLGA